MNLASKLISRATLIESREQSSVYLSFAMVFILMAAYYMLRPVRDAMASDWSNSEISALWNIQFFLSLTVVGLFGIAVSKFNFRYLVPAVYGFFALSFVSFYFGSALVEQQVLLDKAFYLWVSLFSLFHISVFWSLMADLFDSEQSKRLFGFIAVGASAGAIFGPLVAAIVSQTFGSGALMLVASLMMLLPLPIIFTLQRLKLTSLNNREVEADVSNFRIGGSPLQGFLDFIKSPFLIGIAIFLLLYTAIGFERLNEINVQKFFPYWLLL